MSRKFLPPRSRVWTWVLVLTLPLLLALGISSRREQRPDNTPPNDPRAQLVEQVAHEPAEKLLDNLANGYEDVAYAVTGSNLDFTSRPGTYRYACQVVPKLNRVRRVLGAYRDRAKPTEQLRAMLGSAVEHHDALYRAYDQGSFERSKQEAPSADFPERDAMYRCWLNAHVATYLLAEYQDVRALPVLARAFEKPGRAPVSRLYVFYSMHLLVTGYPADRLPAAAREARDRYLAATRDRVPPAALAEVPAWNAKVDETDIRNTILKKNIGLGAVPKVRVREYPPRFAVHENFAPPREKAEAFVDGVSRDVHQWFRLIRAVIAAGG